MTSYECPICLEELVTTHHQREAIVQIAAPCGHVFHAACLSEWERACGGSTSCPLDRHAYNSVATAVVPVLDYERGVPARKSEPASAPPWTAAEERQVRRRDTELRRTVLDLRINDLLCSALSLEQNLDSDHDEEQQQDITTGEGSDEPLRFGMRDIVHELTRRVSRFFHRTDSRLRKAEVIRRIASLDRRLDAYAIALDSKKRLIECLEIISRQGGEDEQQRARFLRCQVERRIMSEMNILKTVSKNAEKKRARLEKQWQRESRS